MSRARALVVAARRLGVSVRQGWYELAACVVCGRPFERRHRPGQKRLRVTCSHECAVAHADKVRHVRRRP